MKSAINIGAEGDAKYGLRSAILLYGDNQTTLATLHAVFSIEGGSPYIGPGQLVSTAFLKSLTKSMGGRAVPEILPADVLVRTPDTMIWWTPARARMTHYRCGNPKDEAQQLDGQRAMHPALVWRVTRRSLWVRALGKSERPAAETKLLVAPYYNINHEGHVCLGNMRIPATAGLETITEWERGFYESAFTHTLERKLTTLREGFTAMWARAARQDAVFPVNLLVDAKQSLAQFAAAEARV